MRASSPEGTEGAARRGLIASALELLAASWSYLRARLELAGLEGREAGFAWLKALAFLLAALGILVFGYLFFWLAAIFAIAFAIGGKAAWIWVTFGAALLHLVAAVALLFRVKTLVAAPLFPITLDELRKDQAWLESKAAKRN